jgi:hypothetical protein
MRTRFDDPISNAFELIAAEHHRNRWKDRLRVFLVWGTLLTLLYLLFHYVI